MLGGGGQARGTHASPHGLPKLKTLLICLAGIMTKTSSPESIGPSMASTSLKRVTAFVGYTAYNGLTWGV